MEIRKDINKKAIQKILIVVAALFIVYFGISIYFMNHFCFGSKINGIKVSGKTVEDVKEELESKVNNYSLNLVERDDKTEQINAADIDLKYDVSNEIQGLKDKQSGFAWLVNIFRSKEYEIESIVAYDDSKLNKKINSLICLDKNKGEEPKSASLSYNDGQYTIVPEVQGNKVDSDKLKEQIIDSIINSKDTLNLEDEGCYVEPKFKSDSQEILDAQAELNKYVGTVVNYNIRGKSETLDGSEIHKWLSVDSDCKVVFDENKVSKYVYSLANKYDTAGITKKFNTSTGKTVQISGGTYGWKIDRNEEVKQLMDIIKEGQTVDRSPEYLQKGNSNDADDIGKSYVEVNLTKQHLWFYKDGSLVTEGDIVSGNPNKNATTPDGIYKLNYKEKDATLKGDNGDGKQYATPVAFWMPFNNGIGLHDATWQPRFGGDRYMEGGSHGCINCPYELAQTIFENIEVNTPIVCYNE